MGTLFEHAGGERAIRRFVEIFYASVLSDTVLKPVFGKGKPDHVDHLTAFEVETFGGPDRLTRELGGFDYIIAVHRNLRITEQQRQRFIELYISVADKAGLPSDPPFRQALREHVEFGTQVAMQNSTRGQMLSYTRCERFQSAIGRNPKTAAQSLENLIRFRGTMGGSGGRFPATLWPHGRAVRSPRTSRPISKGLCLSAFIPRIVLTATIR